MALLIYVDDLVQTSNRFKVYNKLKQYLNNYFKIKDLR